MRYFIELAYNGKQYHGWQNQPNAISVQQVLEKALSTLLKDNIAIVGAGRTDTGVHAKQMFAHFDVYSELDSSKLIYKLNAFLPQDIAVYNLYQVNEEAHARFDALSRTYEYHISARKDVFNADRAYYVKTDIDIEKMNEACKILFDYKNFKCFSRSNTDVKTYNCDILLANWQKTNNQLIFTIKADRFLRNMVRAVVGTMLQIGVGKLKVEDLHGIIKSQDRGEAGPSAPAHGLYLTKIEYPRDII